MGFHRTADVEEQQHLDRVVPLRLELQVEQPGVARRGRDRAVDVELVGRALAREAAQLAQRHLDVARAQLDLVVEVAVLALFPDLHRAALAAGPADADAFGVVAAVAEGRRAAGADPFAAALVPALLLLEPLLQRLHQLVPAAERLDLRHLLGREVPPGQLLQPVGGQFLLQQVEGLLDALEVMREGLVETVEVLLVLDQRGTRKKVEIFDAVLRPRASRAPRAA